MAPNTLDTLTSTTSSAELLTVLKSLKNGVIGNTWKKVELAGDDDVLAYLLQWLELPKNPSVDTAALDIIVEIAVIIGALANVGSLTLRPLLYAQAPQRLLQVITTTRTSTSINEIDRLRLLSALLRALRNVLVSTADLVWGYMWGVSLQRRPVDTGLIGPGSEADENGSTRGKGKGVEKRSTAGGLKGRSMAVDVLTMIFEKDTLDTLLSLLRYSTNLSILSPLYQILARLIALPSHREILVRWTPPDQTDHSRSNPTPFSLSATASSPWSTTGQVPFILLHLINSISSSPNIVDGVSTTSGGLGSARRNPKLLEAALDLLAALVKDQPDLARIIRHWPDGRTYLRGPEAGAEGDEGGQGFMGELLVMMRGSPTAVRIAAASCLTNLTKSEGEGYSARAEESNVRRGALNRHILDVVVQLLKGEVMEERIKLCFILASLVSDDPALQRAAADRGCPVQLLGLYIKVDEEENRGELGADPASRAREAILIALASLAFQTESTRSLISEHQPPFLPNLLKSLRHPSYGVRAASCQLARALSRNIAVLRTSLIDSGVADEIIDLLKRECNPISPEDIGEREELTSSEDRGWMVEVAAMGTICNLVPDFSPLRTKLLSNGGLTSLVGLTRSLHEPLALNALWAIKNLTFRAPEGMKSTVMSEMGYDHLKLLMTTATLNSLRVQAFCILRNLVADQTPAELSRTVDAFGEKDILDLLQVAVRDKDLEIRSASIFTLSNIALGNERMRQALVSRLDIVEGLSDALNSKSDQVKHAALRTLRHLIEASTRSRRPRQAMVELFHPYQLKPRLTELSDGATGFDVRHAAGGLLEVLERGRGAGDGGFGTAR